MTSIEVKERIGNLEDIKAVHLTKGTHQLVSVDEKGGYFTLPSFIPA